MIGLFNVIHKIYTYQYPISWEDWHNYNTASATTISHSSIIVWITVIIKTRWHIHVVKSREYVGRNIVYEDKAMRFVDRSMGYVDKRSVCVDSSSINKDSTLFLIPIAFLV